MQLWRRSIQWPLVISVGSALLVVIWLARGLVRPVRQVTAGLVAIGTGR